MTTTFRDAAVTEVVTSGSPSAFTKPTLTQAGDLQLMFVVIDGVGDTSTGPTGGATWILVGGARQDISNGDTQTLWLYAQVAGLSEPSTYAQSFSHAANNCCALIVAYSGVDVSGGAAAAIAAFLWTNPNSVSVPTSPVSMATNAITTTAPNQTVVWGGGVDWNSASAGTLTAPGSTSTRVSFVTGPFVNGLVVDFVQAGAGSTGTITGTGTLAAASGNFAAFLAALKDAPPSGPSLMGHGIFVNA